MLVAKACFCLNIFQKNDFVSWEMKLIRSQSQTPYINKCGSRKEADMRSIECPARLGWKLNVKAILPLFLQSIVHRLIQCFLVRWLKRRPPALEHKSYLVSVCHFRLSSACFISPGESRQTFLQNYFLLLHHTHTQSIRIHH